MPVWLEAGLWGLLGGGALVIGAGVTWAGLITSLGFLLAFAIHLA